jgi:hypothetical protein
MKVVPFIACDRRSACISLAEFLVNVKLKAESRGVGPKGPAITSHARKGVEKI